MYLASSRASTFYGDLNGTYGSDRVLRVLLQFVLRFYERRSVVRVLIGSFADMEYSRFLC